jgi:uncharacterized membrane protein YdjX (TVP38/TMEM64 family)
VTDVVAHSPTASRSTGLLRLGLFAAILVAAWVLARALGVTDQLTPSGIVAAVERLRAMPWILPAFIAAYAVVAGLGLPGTPMTLAGGALFGAVGGTFANWTGATIGATAAFFLARALGSDAVRRILGKNAGLLDRLIANAGFLAMLRLRLIPVVPFNALNFGAGLAGVKPSTYLASTALGIIPGTAVYTYFADALLAGADGARESAFTQLLIAAGLLIALSFIPTIAKRMGWIAGVALLLAAPPATAQSTVDHSAWSALLTAHVKDGIVDYDAFAREPRFAAYLRSLDAVRPATLARHERLAYWMNVYNAFTIQLINSRGERGSIRNINKKFGVTLKSPWAEPIVRAGGRVLTLDDVEHEIIRKEFQDPRIHAALVCAALGCPPLRSEAFTGARLDEQLDDQNRRFLAQSSKNRVDVATRTVYASPIFVWYQVDFGGSTAGVGTFWARYVSDPAAKALLTSGDFTLKQTDYDWTLNSPAHARRAGGK